MVIRDQCTFANRTFIPFSRMKLLAIISPLHKILQDITDSIEPDSDAFTCHKIYFENMVSVVYLQLFIISGAKVK